MRGRGRLGFTFPVLTPGPVPLPSLWILPPVPAPGKDSAQEDSYDETGEDHGEDPGDVPDGCGRGVDSEGSCRW